MREHQKRGIGLALAKAAIAVGRSQGFSRFTLISVQQSILWNKLGFQKAEDEPDSVLRKLAFYGDWAVFVTGQFGLSR
jgi:GNAT superfamily N-acetyltransferase